jgi:branched-chain amino acid transport system ATP-binding protein
MLEIKKVETFYDKIQALRGVDISVKEGEIVSLIGSNGAGKSTLLMTVSGVHKAKVGTITFEGKNIEKEEPHNIVNLGISQVPEGRRIFSKLTVEENLRLGSYAYEKGKHYDRDIKSIFDLFPVLNDRKKQRGGTLSGGEQQMLAIGRSLMSNPKMLLLDEPSLGIAPKLVNQIFVAIKNINKEKKVTIFLVEQNAKKALELADRAYVLVNGKVFMQGTGKDLLNNDDVKSAYLEGAAKTSP